MIKVDDIAKETLDILKYFNSDFVSKIPNKFLENLKMIAETSQIAVNIDRDKKLEEQEIYQLFDLAVSDSKGKVSYDIAEYIMSNDELRQCIRFAIKNKDDVVWKNLLNEINQEGQL